VSLGAVFLEQRDALAAYLRRRTGSVDASQDLLQETWLRVQTAQHPAELRNPAAYLFRLAGNLALDWRRREQARARRLRPDAEMERAVDREAGPEQVLHGREVARVLAEAIEALPPKCRQVFLLYRGEGLSLKAIGAELGISERTAENHVARAVVECRRRLRAEGLWP
jgi:RNA polymerase sigma-70 factor (ECF subfamily)